MVLRLTCMAVVAAALLSVFCAVSQPAAAAGRVRDANDLFFNFYVPPCYAGGVGAEIYPCPRPTPPSVGHTYVTYQPLMPHEFLYRHSRTYVHKHPTGQVTRTKVNWR